MKLKYLSTVIDQSNEISYAGALCFAPNGHKLAVATADRHILLFDEKFRKRDKFATKPIDPKFGKSNHLITCAVFSPDSLKLAIGQTDHIVFVYRLGESWEEKKVICNKFAQSSAVTALIWPSDNKLIVGLSDGKVRLASSTSNKCSTLYRADTDVCMLAQHPNRLSFLSGHEDGTVYMYSFNTRSHSYLFVHSCSPHVLLYSSVGILVGGIDRRLVSYTEHGRVLQQFDYSDGQHNEKEFTVAALDPTGHNAVIGSFDKIRSICWNQQRGAWDEGSLLHIHNLYTVTGLAWKSDATTLLCMNVLGAVIAIDCSTKKTMLNNRFELTFISLSHAIIRDLKAMKNNSENEESNGNVEQLVPLNGHSDRPIECLLHSRRGAELRDIRVMGRDQRYAIIYTPTTLIFADMWTGKSSEILWRSGGNEKFYLDNENIAYIVNAGEINFVEYGRDELVGWIRTERANIHQISVRIYYPNMKKLHKQQQQQQNTVESTCVRRVAYLLDARTISIIDLKTNVQIAQIQHGSAIDWLELNEKANKLLYRDIHAALHLFSYATMLTTDLIAHCSYVQWVPKSDVIVAQSNDHLCVWYNTDEHADRIIQLPIQGEIEMVVRDATRTEVIVMENDNRVAYELDNAMIEFGTALDEFDLGRAVLFLEQSEQRGMDLQAMWKKLAEISIEHFQLMLAQRCFASLNDLIRVQYLQETLLRAECQHGIPMDEMLSEHFEVRARMAIMGKQFKRAERIFLENNAVSAAIQMWRLMCDWDTVMQLAIAMNYSQMDSLHAQYERYLHESGQQQKAAEIKLRDGDENAALELFLRAKQPLQAVELLLKNRNMLKNLTNAEGEEGILERITKTLIDHELFDKIGELYEAIEQPEKALNYYKQGNIYGKAIQIARECYPDQVVPIEEQWANWLFTQGNYDPAISHFLECGNVLRAADSAIHAREWDKALEILNAIDPIPETTSLYEKIAEHFELIRDFDKAELIYINSGKFLEAIEMYNKAGHWISGFTLASKFLNIDESRKLYMDKAVQLMNEMKFSDAEELYIALDEPNKAIAMYKQAERVDDMMRLISRFHSNEVQNAHKLLAEELEQKGDFRAAEEHYMLSSNWSTAIDMYQHAEQWADAYRLAKAHSGEQTQKQIAYLWAKTLGGDAAIKLLTKFELLDEAINLAVFKGDYDFAFELSRLGAVHRLKFVQQSYAEHLEDEGDLEKAEELFLKAGKSREAVSMHIHSQNWDAAERIAENYCTDLLPEIFLQRARSALEQHNYVDAESYLLRANRPDIILSFYRESAQWLEAMRIAKDYLPDQLEQCRTEYDEYQLRSGAKGAESLIAQAKEWERQNEHHRAVDCWMQVEGATQDQQLIAHSLTKAAELTVKFLTESDDGIELLLQIAQRQNELGQFLAAGESFLLGNQPAKSVQALLDAHEWAKAKRVAEELAPELGQLVDDTYREFLRTHGRIGELIDVDVVTAIDMLVQDNQWEKALKTARQQNHRPLFDKYLILYANEQLTHGKPEYLLKALRKFGPSTNQKLIPVYETLIDQLINVRTATQNYEMLKTLRDVFLQLSQQIDTTENNINGQQNNQQYFKRFLYLAHFSALRKALELLSEQQSPVVDHLKILQLKLSIAMLRYIEPLRPDKAFYEAGIACKLWGGTDYEKMAFLFLNQYLDITDAIDENDPNLVDNGVYEGTDIPTNYALPNEKYLSNTEQDEVKEWVLAISVDQNMEKLLRLDGRDSYEASAIDTLGNSYPICVVSAYPVTDETRELDSGQTVDHKAWIAFTALLKQNPTDELLDVQQFLDSWSNESVAA